ncbi:TRAP transporter large permease [Anaerotruncus sp. AF02-27]|uniref:TRAP transporter large permease n=1 Tax=Anaerotruncus sp. AF02-27 TaxID=2292191 RepID=UPI000E47A6F8|nr:TRAP transporter large permease [Anaerotruncus sp. AF02-27]RGX57028.1 TRAP transporter large permease [Anaerotruncus sp. AF02-27]
MNYVLFGLIGMIILMIMVFNRLWVGASLIFVGFFGYAYINGFTKSLIMVSMESYTQVGSYSFAVVVLFTFMGTVLAGTGMADDLFKTADAWLGSIRGGIAIATLAACGVFAAVCGSSTASALTMSKAAFPEMKKLNYDERLSAATISAGGTIGILIPPSIGFIMYGLITENSIAKLFMAGLVPGITQVLFYMVTVWIVLKIHPDWAPDNSNRKLPLKEKIRSLKGTWSMIVLIIVIMGGLYGGIFTATEAGAVGAVTSVLLALFSKKLTKKNFMSVSIDTAKTTGMVVFMLTGAYIFTRFLTVTRLPERMSEMAQKYAHSELVLILAICLLYIILGMFLDIYAIIILSIPILYPTIVAAGMNPIWFGVLMVRLMEVGMISPPYGVNLFVTSSATGVPLNKMYRGSIPFLIADALHIAMLIAFPQVALCLVK